MLEFLLSEDARLRKYADKGKAEKVKECIEHGAHVDTKDVHGNPALMHAVQHNHVDVAKVLLDSNEPVDDRGEFGMTPLILAAKLGHKDMCELLLTRGADVNAGNEFNCTALTKAILNHHMDVMQLLLEKGAIMEIKDSEGKDCVYYACHLDIVEPADVMLEFATKHKGSQETIARLTTAACRKNRH
mmetsp:Transcript_21195/g.36416  ORF Transcript_21195/g.36416 Transcript_21195/m.36416 type:complete len:187 (+) Transcript_21195:201-761(+)|eukprot:CAMPEP_0184692146 /NCGR_PEP_ID=MMETSP0313-20130426/747_1 /TAXON_ID=2792 /ORGANISM="Porphyridium aerugineum, Strain SAG 1380-2" /LENGTH=186 /DNA_ID=CAMNT_0027149955 /DNA_START=112 /DNA_END=672 /DNA_ORIENTATION=+